jgi:hypothetical protein
VNFKATVATIDVVLKGGGHRGYTIEAKAFHNLII